jgi:hypothetical protein
LTPKKKTQKKKKEKLMKWMEKKKLKSCSFVSLSFHPVMDSFLDRGK